MEARGRLFLQIQRTEYGKGVLSIETLFRTVSGDRKNQGISRREIRLIKSRTRIDFFDLFKFYWKQSNLRTTLRNLRNLRLQIMQGVIL